MNVQGVASTDDRSHALPSAPWPPSVVAFRDLEAQRFAKRLYRLPAFVACHTEVQDELARTLARCVATKPGRRLFGMTPEIDLWTVVSLSLQAVAPGLLMLGQDERGQPALLIAAGAGRMTMRVGQAARDLCRQVGYDMPSVRLQLWAAIALLWPSERVSDLAPVLPRLLPASVDIRTSALTFEAPDATLPAPPKGERAAILGWYDRGLTASGTQPAGRYNLGGRPGIATDGPRTAARRAIADEALRLLAANPHLSWDQVRARTGAPSVKSLRRWCDARRRGDL